MGWNLWNVDWLSRTDQMNVLMTFLNDIMVWYNVWQNASWNVWLRLYVIDRLTGHKVVRTWRMFFIVICHIYVDVGNVFRFSVITIELKLLTNIKVRKMNK